MISDNRLAVIVIATLLSVVALAQDTDSDSDEARQSKELAKAMQNAQLLLSELTDAFDCDYAGYDVTPTKMTNGTTYMVIIAVEQDACDDMVKALNYEGAGLNLNFVSEKEMPAMDPIPEPSLIFGEPPIDNTLIHEVNPPVDQ